MTCLITFFTLTFVVQLKKFCPHLFIFEFIHVFIILAVLILHTSAHKFSIKYFHHKPVLQNSVSEIRLGFLLAPLRTASHEENVKKLQPFCLFPAELNRGGVSPQTQLEINSKL